ncbi:MAG: polysaccharide biosynthesis tyrosine autokinase [Anaerolineae bacterium]
MDLRQYWHLLRRWLWLIVLGALVGGSLAYVIGRNTKPVYEASTTLLIAPGNAQALDNYSTLIASERLARTYAQLLTSSPVIEETYQRLDEMAAEGLPVGDLSSSFSISALPVRDTQLLQVAVTGTDPQLITSAANALVDGFIEWQTTIQRERYAESKSNLALEMEQIQSNIDEIEGQIRTLQEAGDSTDQNELIRLQDQLVQYQNSYSALLSSYSDIGLAEANSSATVTVISPAVAPTAPIRPRILSNTLLAAVLGALAGAGLAFLLEYMDDTVKTPEDLQATGLGAIGIVQRVPSNGKKSDSPIFSINQPKSLAAEAYRTLRTNLQFSSLDTPLRSLVVTSAVATEGKTTTAANLAVVMAQAGNHIVLVDGDLRRPSAHKLFGLPNRTGLTTALVEDPQALNGYLQESGIENLRVLTAGPIPPNPQELLGSQRMKELLCRLEDEADVVVIDTPPTLVVSDANVLAARASGVLMVVNTGKTRRAAVRQAVEGLRKVGANLLGCVLNMVTTRGGRSAYYYSSYYYSHYYGDGRDGGRRGIVGRLRRLGRDSRRRHASSDHDERKVGQERRPA